MDPFTVGVISVLVIVAIAVGVAIANGARIRRPGGGNSPRPVDLVSFAMRPRIICSKRECSVEIDYSVEPDGAGAAVSLSVRTPRNRTIPVSNQMQLRRIIPGDDSFWSDGPGQYTFTWRATGLQQGDITNVHDVHVIPASGGTVLDSISFTFNPNDQNRRVVGDIAIFGTVAGRKGRSLDTCEKYMALASIRYVSGGIAGFPRDLSINVSDGAGQAQGTAILLPNPGSDTLLLPNPVPIQNGIAIESQMASGTGPEFPIGRNIPWVLEYTFKCL